VALPRARLKVKAMSYTNTPTLSYLPTLVIDTNAAAAEQLANQLSHSGFTADIAIDCRAAQTAARRRYYGAMIFVADLSRPSDVKCLAELRKGSSRTWIIVISSTAPSEAQKALVRHEADALLIAPFTTEDLISRLFAFSLRSRPP
jgi:DNA-binding response OmpR family regulator